MHISFRDKLLEVPNIVLLVVRDAMKSEIKKYSMLSLRMFLGK